MDFLQISLCFLALAGAFTLVSLGALLLKCVSTLKEVDVLSRRLDETVDKANLTIDDINNKMEKLNAPFEIVDRFFNRTRHSKNSMLVSLLGMTRKNKKRKESK